MITIVDYGVGNLNAFVNVYKRLTIPIAIAKNSGELAGATRIILPGVGHFDHAMQELNKSGMRTTLDELVLDKKVPVIGICVGMQMMALSSDEGNEKGLGWLDAEVKKFDINLINYRTRLPHMGWNDVTPTRPNNLFKGLEADAIFYFLHSYYFCCNNPQDSIASTDYGIKFTSSVNNENIYGIQFHPEKSHSYGETLLSNFASV